MRRFGILKREAFFARRPVARFPFGDAEKSEQRNVADMRAFFEVFRFALLTSSSTGRALAGSSITSSPSASR